jgi:hypothetical protein
MDFLFNGIKLLKEQMKETENQIKMCKYFFIFFDISQLFLIMTFLNV